MGRSLSSILGLGLIASLLAGCDTRSDDSRPPAKPETLDFALVQSDAGAPGKKVLSQARISTKSGEILILEPDGSVSEMTLDSREGRDAFAVTEADLLALNENMDLDLSGLRDMGPVTPRGPTAQEKALADFQARTKPLRLGLPESFSADPEDFIGANVKAYPSKRKSGDSLVEVTANLRGGVDADTAFAYATCALANWADAEGAPYARHIRTLRDKRNDKMIVGSVFTLSQQKPMGLTVMTTKDTLQECKSRGIPAA